MSIDALYYLDELRRALHDPRGSKAAVMIGAGFSTNAQARGEPGVAFPTWKDLTEMLVKRLYPEPGDYKRKLEESGATSSALRFAKEFEVAFGRPALTDLVRETIRDDDFIPGDVHRDLLALPWADVFTTNYDRLLERAAERTWNRKYDIVLSSDDLPLARRPRVVKLHGSLPDLNGLILTEDDFRSYPRRHAPFVNAVQASLSENIFCLMGFSASDPNFLAWTGWVRDELAESAPYMFLFTGSNLRPFQRQLLESRRIIPVQILELTGEGEYSRAYQRLFRQLGQRADPSGPSWNRTPGFFSVQEEDPGEAREPLHAPLETSEEAARASWWQTALIWRRHRLKYAGWHILYRPAIQRLWTSTQFWIQGCKRAQLDRLEPPVALLVIHELAWRTARCLVPLPDDVVFTVIDPTLEAYVQWKDTQKECSLVIGDEIISATELDAFELELRLQCLRHAREIGDNERFERLVVHIDSLLNQRALTAHSNERQFVIHQRVLYSLFRLEHRRARELLISWDVTNANIIWAVRKAGIFLECGLKDSALRSLIHLLGSLRRIPATAEAQTVDCLIDGVQAMNLPS